MPTSAERCGEKACGQRNARERDEQRLTGEDDCSYAEGDACGAEEDSAEDAGNPVEQAHDVLHS
jgi:hypothetical protein